MKTNNGVGVAAVITFKEFGANDRILFIPNDGNPEGVAIALAQTIATEDKWYGDFVDKFYRAQSLAVIAKENYSFADYRYHIMEDGKDGNFNILAQKLNPVYKVVYKGKFNYETLFRGCVADFINQYADSSTEKALLPIGIYNRSLRTYPSLIKEFNETLDEIFDYTQNDDLLSARESLCKAKEIAQILNKPQALDQLDSIYTDFFTKEQQPSYDAATGVADVLATIQQQEEESRSQTLAS